MERPSPAAGLNFSSEPLSALRTSSAMHALLARQQQKSKNTTTPLSGPRPGPGQGGLWPRGCCFLVSLCVSFGFDRFRHMYAEGAL